MCASRDSVDSVTSEYGSESESGLVSRTMLEPSDVQAVTQLDFALPRYILMLDVWISQVRGLHGIGTRIAWYRYEDVWYWYEGICIK